MPGLFSSHSPVITDALGYLRNAKYPTIGPIERRRSDEAATVLHRYVHDSGTGLALRETYRFTRNNAIDFTRCEGTRILPVASGDGGTGAQAVPPALRGAGRKRLTSQVAYASIVTSRRDARAVEWAGLENRCTLAGTVGSNPTLSAILLRRSAMFGRCEAIYRAVQLFRLVHARTR